mmetsp:Transcript_22074/g.45946  ORF Transcript_22074/g.45946 Transcript_22074/m.45946 type:complete len:200 (-) Transcript_22074:148-747(-)
MRLQVPRLAVSTRVRVVEERDVEGTSRCVAELIPGSGAPHTEAHPVVQVDFCGFEDAVVPFYGVGPASMAKGAYMTRVCRGGAIFGDELDQHAPADQRRTTTNGAVQWYTHRYDRCSSRPSVTSVASVSTWAQHGRTCVVDGGGGGIATLGQQRGRRDGAQQRVAEGRLGCQVGEPLADLGAWHDLVQVVIREAHVPPF